MSGLLPESRESYGKKVRLSKGVRTHGKGDSLEVDTNDVKCVGMNELYRNDGVKYRVLSAVSGKNLVNIKPTDRKYYYDESIPMDSDNRLTGSDSYVTLEISARNENKDDYTFHLPSARLMIRNSNVTLEDCEAMLMNPFDAMGHLKLETGREVRFYIAFVVRDSELRRYRDRLCLLIDGKGQLMGESKHLTEVLLRIGKTGE